MHLRQDAQQGLYMGAGLMGDDVMVVPNDAGIIGGVRAWEL